MTDREKGEQKTPVVVAKQVDASDTEATSLESAKSRGKSSSTFGQIKKTEQSQEQKGAVSRGEPAPAKSEKKDMASQNEKSAVAKRTGSGGRKMINNLREYRIEQMMSKAELARKAGLSVLTIDRIEKGFGCRMDTKRKILKALGFSLTDRRKVFKDE